VAPDVRLEARGPAQHPLEPFVEVGYPTLPLFVEKLVVEMSAVYKNVGYEGVGRKRLGLRGVRSRVGD